MGVVRSMVNTRNPGLRNMVRTLTILLLTVMLLPLATLTTPAEDTNSPPKFIDPSYVMKATVGVRSIFNCSAVDPDGDMLNYSLLSAPEGMYLDDPGICLIKFLPIAKDMGERAILIQVDDGNGGVAYQNITIQVEAPPNPVVEIESPGIGETVSGTVRIEGYVDTGVDVETYVDLYLYASFGTPQSGNYANVEPAKYLVPEGSRICNFSMVWDTSQWSSSPGRYILDAVASVGIGGDPGEFDSEWVTSGQDFRIINIAPDLTSPVDPDDVRVTIVEPTMDEFILPQTTMTADIFVPEMSTLAMTTFNIMDLEGYNGQTFTNYTSFKGPGNVSVSWDFDLTEMKGATIEVAISAQLKDQTASDIYKDSMLIAHVADDGDTDRPHLYIMNPWDQAWLNGEVKVEALLTCGPGLETGPITFNIRGPAGPDPKGQPLELKSSDTSCPRAEILETFWDTHMVPDDEYDLQMAVGFTYGGPSTQVKGEERISAHVTVSNVGLLWEPIDKNQFAWVVLTDPQDGAIRSDQETINFEGYVFSQDTVFGSGGTPPPVNTSSPIISKVTLMDEGTPVGEWKGTGTYGWSIKVGPLTAGVHNISILLDASYEDGSFASSSSFMISITILSRGGEVPIPDSPSLVAETGTYEKGVVTSEDGVVSFKAPALGGNRQAAFYLWDFGDGTTSVEATPIHTYAEPGNYSVKLTVSDGAKTFSFTNVVVVENGVGAQASDGGQPVINVGGDAQLYVIITALVLCVVGIALGGTEMGLYAIFPFFVWLYTKIKNVEVLDHYLRGKIHGYIIANPGEHYNQIKDALCLNNGSLAYHLRVLEREGYVKSLREGVYKRFYPASATMPADRLTPMERLIMREIKDRIGITQKEIAGRIEESPQVVNYHIKNLESKGTVRLERYGRETLCYAAEDYIPRHPWEKIQT